MNRSQYYIMQKKHEDYLMHHGIDGQKWGVKHGPPYPLDSSESTGSRLKTKKKKKKKKQIDPGEKAAIERGAHKGRWGGVIGSLIGASIADAKYKRNKKKEASKKEDTPEQTWTEETHKSIPAKREASMRSTAKKYLAERGGPWNDGSELKFLSERVITEKDGSKTTETMFANNNAWITVETSYDTNGKIISKRCSLDD